MSSPDTVEKTKSGGTAPRQRRLTIARALNEAIHQEMAADASVVVLGEDLAKIGGVWSTTGGLLDAFGADRVRDTPISESGFIGAAVGMAAVGLRPIVELMFVDFFGVCMNAISSLAAKQRFFSGGQVKCPMVLMTSVGGGYSDGGQHSQCLYATFGHLPGLKVVIPSNAYDAKGMLRSAIHDDDPVVFMFHKGVHGLGWLGTVPRAATHVPEEEYYVPLGKAAVTREGTDLTFVGLGLTVHHAIDAANVLQKEGVSCEVIDLRSIAPLDRDTVRASVRKTGRLIAVDDDYLSYGVSGEIIATVCEDPGITLRATPRRLCFPDIPIPFSPALEPGLLPNGERLAALAREVLSEKRA
ncbi:MAG: alpha-ketoacid dehydrogenase subunit beta [Sphingomonadales bacterium]|nr:alpha-ketoacid dehydrogenase subunit beta [Sphingomonadales bacterium]